MKVVHVVYNCQPGNHRGGVSKAVHELALAQHSSSIEVEVWSVADVRGEDRSHGYLHRRFIGSSWLGSVNSRDILLALRNVRRPAVIHLHNTFHALNISVGRCARRIGLKCVYHTHGALDPVLLRGLSMKSFKKKLYCIFFEIPSLNKANAVIALTNQEAKGLREIGVTAPIHEVPNGIKMPAGITRRPSADNLISNLVYIGRIHPKKRLEDMISALAILRRQGHDLRLMLAGDPQQFPGYTAELEHLVEKLGISQSVQWMGFRNESQKRELLESADIFLHASESEGMAMSILEAMSYGVPVVASRGCYMSSAASAGALVEYGAGHEQLAQCISILLSKPIADLHALGKSGQDYVINVHSWSTISSRLSYIYESC